MRFLLTLWGDERRWEDLPPEAMGAVMAEYQAFFEEARAAGVMLGGEALEGTAAAATVRVRDERTLVSDGPFAETKEQLGGYYLFECRDRDEALAWAAEIPAARDGCIEVRPVIDYEAAGYDRQADETTA
jgi:hypothetical protein